MPPLCRVAPEHLRVGGHGAHAVPGAGGVAAEGGVADGLGVPRLLRRRRVHPAVVGRQRGGGRLLDGGLGDLLGRGGVGLVGGGVVAALPGEEAPHQHQHHQHTDERQPRRTSRTARLRHGMSVSVVRRLTGAALGDEALEHELGVVVLEPLEPVLALEQRHERTVGLLEDSDTPHALEHVGAGLVGAAGHAVVGRRRARPARRTRSRGGGRPPRTASGPTAASTGAWSPQVGVAQHLHHALLVELGDAPAELLVPGRCRARGRRRSARGRSSGCGGNSTGPVDLEGVADAHLGGVHEADDVAREGLLEGLALLAEDRWAYLVAKGLPVRPWVTTMPRSKLPGAHPQEGDAVAVRRVHVGLHLEHEARRRGRRAVAGRALDVGPGPGDGHQVDDGVEQHAHAEVGERRAEEHRGGLAGQEQLDGRGRRRPRRAGSISSRAASQASPSSAARPVGLDDLLRRPRWRRGRCG